MMTTIKKETRVEETYWSISLILMIIPSLLAVLYGCIFILPKHKGLYVAMGILATACIFLGEFSDFASYMTGHTVERTFHVGSLGTVGYHLFLLAASVGPLDSLADDGRRELRRYRWLALLGPGIAMAFYSVCVAVMAVKYEMEVVLTGFLLTVMTLGSIYFSTKMAIIPDTKNGFLHCMRPYNILVTGMGLLLTAERGLRYLWSVGEGHPIQSVLLIIFYAAIGLNILASVIALQKGVDKWLKI